MTFVRLALVALAAGFVAAPRGAIFARQAVQPAPPYFHIATLPGSVGGRSLRTFAFDPGTKRLFIASDAALFRVNPAPAATQLEEIARRRFHRLEMAPDQGKLFFIGHDEVGFVDVTRAEARPVRLAALASPTDLAYEPTLHELYVSTYRGPIVVFDTRSNQMTAKIEVSGWTASALEAAPGRVFVTVDRTHGLHVVTAGTRRIDPWPVTGRISTPAQLEADPEGRYLFMAYDREIVAIDIATASVTGRVFTATQASIAFDPSTRLLIATWDDDPPPTRVVAFEVGEHGLREVTRLRNPALGMSGVEPTSGGFLQRGSRALLLWASQPLSARGAK